MTSIDSFVPNGLLDVLASDDNGMDLDKLSVHDSQVGKLMANVLLPENESQEETLVEKRPELESQGLLDEEPEKWTRVDEGGFKSNGLFDDIGDTQDAFKSSGLLDGVTEDTDDFQANRLVDERNDASGGGFGIGSIELRLHNNRDTFESSELLDQPLELNVQCEPEETLVETQEELPSLRQILYPNGRVQNELSHKEERSSSSLSFGLFGSVPATTFDGKTIYFKKKSKFKSRTTAVQQHFGNLLERPVHKLKDQLSEITAAKLSQPEAGPSATAVLKPVDNELWVDRYRPARFIDLLGDERMHRETMGWLKEWDYCVFGKRKALNRPKKTFDSQDANSENNYEDAYHRPREKLLLLSGPAGFGKTTLAHVVARQAGYEVMEINASDSRSGQVIDDRIRPTLEAGSAVGSKKPVCIVIDEIDGATGAGENSSTFIHRLIGLTFDKTKKKGRGDKNKNTQRPLLRPIICICNDLYAAALTKLRQHARIIRFQRPADVYLTKRLRSICEMEGLRAESRALTALVGIAKGDMRGCLNTLQFIKARKQEVTESVIRAATVGMKEGDASFTSIMSGLFAPLAKKRVKELGMSELDEGRYVSRLSSDIDAGGSIDKVALGCFEHYINLRHYEASLSRHEKAANWLAAFDSLSGAMRSEREYGLIPYLSYSIVPFYPLFNERGGARVDRPKADWDALMRTRTNEEIYKSLSKCVQSAAGQRCTGLRYFLSNEIMQLELAPYINRIISPPMRPVNSQVTKPQERALLARLVDIMVSLELRFVQEKAEDGQLVYRLDPPVDAFVTYDGKRAPDIAVQRYATRRVIAGEIDAQLIARHAEVIERGKTKTLDMFRKARKGNDNDDPEEGMAEGTDRFALGKRKAETLDIADKPPVDFFGRPITTFIAPASKKSKGAGSTAGAAMAVEKKFKVSYRFKEGNSAAVRKPVKVSTFL